jgi:hypothetical protein
VDRGIVGESIPTICLTPLYHFSSDTADLVIDQNMRICAVDDATNNHKFDQEVLANLSLCKPDRLLFHDSLLSLEYFRQNRSSHDDLQRSADLIEACVHPTRTLLRSLRLFAPGHLHAGESFVLTQGKSGNIWRVLGSSRASDMAVDYSVLRVDMKTYALNVAEIPAFHEFRATISPVLGRLSSFPAAEFALFLYSADDGERLDFSAAVTALEALLTRAGETEGLTYRLSMRVANLLGHDAAARKAKFNEMKKFCKRSLSAVLKQPTYPAMGA